MTDNAVLTRKQKFGYGLGHILNDLCASMWFTYLLLYFHKVLEFDNVYAGVVLFVGQIADGLSTVFVGISSDRGDDYWLCRKFGRRKSWHLLGTVCVLGTFPPIFLKCVGCENADQYAQLIYYSSFVCIFQFGWAAIQISHLAMIPELSHCSDERSGLTAIRNSATVLSNITVYLVAWLFLGIRDRSGSDEQIGPDDATAFRNIVLVVLSIGTLSSVLFHFMIPHDDAPSHLPPPTVPPPTRDSADFPDVSVQPDLPVLPCTRRPVMGILQWFGQPQLYQVALVYLSTRLFVNLSQAYIPLYLQVTLELHATSVATVPLVIFVSGFCTSLILERSKKLISRKLSFPVGCLIGISACLWIKFGCEYGDCPSDSNYASRQIYGIAVLIGATNSILLVASLSLTADLIGPNVDSSAFIYGFMSLADKVCNGTAVILIQKFVPDFTDSCINCRRYFESVLVWGCGGSALLGLLAVISLLPMIVGERRGSETSSTPVEEPSSSSNLTVNEEANERTPLLATA